MSRYLSCHDSARRGSSWVKPLALLATVSILTGAGVYGVGLQRAPEAEVFTAVATVYHSEPAGRGSDRAVSPGAGWFTDAAIRDAVRGTSDDPSRVAEIRGNLRVSSDKPQAAGWIRTTLAYTGASPEEALHTVNLLARHFAEREQSAAVAMIRDAIVQARASTEQARQELHAAEWELEQFVRRHFEQLGERKGDSFLAPQKSGQGPAQAASEKPSGLENPEWCDLRDQVARLQRQREEMLLVRTPEHPAVKDLGQELARLESLLAGVPRYLPGGAQNGRSAPFMKDASSPDLSPTISRAPEASRGQAWQPAEEEFAASEGFAVRQTALEKARQKYEQAAAAERQLREQELQLVAPEVQLAERCHVAPGGIQRSRLAATALAAGLAVAAGAGLFWMGAVRDPALSSLAEIQAALPVTVMGVVSVPSRPEPSPALSRTFAGARALMAICGIAIVVVSLGTVGLVLLS